MKMHLLSDVHQEHYKDHGESLIKSLDSTGIDALILAGDITSARFSMEWLKDIQRYVDLYPHTFYVWGNHEFYGSDGPITADILRGIAPALGPTFTLLDHTVPPVEFMGHRFLGGAMWFRPLPDDVQYMRFLNDFSVIKRATPWVWEENLKFINYYCRHARKGDIVITHHMPSPKSISKQFEGSPINRYFVCDMEDLIKMYRPAIWMHGHTHNAFDYVFEDTRIVCNPRGYPSEHLGQIYGPQVIEI